MGSEVQFAVSWLLVFRLVAWQQMEEGAVEEAALLRGAERKQREEKSPVPKFPSGLSSNDLVFSD